MFPRVLVSCTLFLYLSSHIKSVIVDDFRGITISPVFKALEYCILVRCENLFKTSDNQFGFKKGSGCSHAVHAFRCVTDYYNSSGSTVNICALDLSKAFDKMTHHGLFIQVAQLSQINRAAA